MGIYCLACLGGTVRTSSAVLQAPPRSLLGSLEACLFSLNTACSLMAWPRHFETFRKHNDHVSLAQYLPHQKNTPLVKKAEYWRIDAFELWCLRRLLRVPWNTRRYNQSILNISPGCSLEGLMMRLKLQYFGHLMGRVDSLEKTLILGRIGGRRRRGWQRMRWQDGLTDSMDMSLSEPWSSWWTGRTDMLQFMGSERVQHDWATELNWTEWTELIHMSLLHWISSPFRSQSIEWRSLCYTVCSY